MAAGPEEESFRSYDRSRLTKSAVWDEFRGRPRFFKFVQLAEDGGLSEVPQLFTYGRIPWALLSLVFLALNMYALVAIGLQHILDGQWWQISEDQVPYLPIGRIIHGATGRWANEEFIVGCLELALLICLVFMIFMSVARWCCTKCPVEGWHIMYSLLWRQIPDLMTFSSMRLLNFVAPSILVPSCKNYASFAYDRFENGAGVLHSLLPLLSYLLFVALCAVVGFEAFMVKFLSSANLVLANGKSGGWGSFLAALSFLNQILGIVQVNPLLQERLFIFVFAGEDSAQSEREALIQQTWCAMIAAEIWKVAHEETIWKVAPEEKYRLRLPKMWFLTVMLSYSDVDFQHLTLNRGQQPQSAFLRSAELVVGRIASVVDTRGPVACRVCKDTGVEPVGNPCQCRFADRRCPQKDTEVYKETIPVPNLVGAADP